MSDMADVYAVLSDIRRGLSDAADKLADAKADTRAIQQQIRNVESRLRNLEEHVNGGENSILVRVRVVETAEKLSGKRADELAAQIATLKVADEQKRRDLEAAKNGKVVALLAAGGSVLAAVAQGVLALLKSGGAS